MKTFLAMFFVTICAVSGYGQTLKALAYNTTNGVVAYSGTNTMTFNNSVGFAQGDYVIDSSGAVNWQGELAIELDGRMFYGAWNFDQPGAVRTNLGLGATWLTNTNVTNFRSAIGLGSSNAPTFNAITANTISSIYGTMFEDEGSGINVVQYLNFTTNLAATTRTNLGLGATNNVAFRNITSDGNIVISNQSAATNGLLFVYRTNNEPFLGIANFIANNNTTLSNETLFRVGVAEATNRSAQFGFRTVRTNNGGEGFATFSVYGYNALMMIGPSDRSRTNTATNAGIEADIWTITPTNRVATLRDTNSGAFTLHQELGFSTGGITTNAPANTTNVALWLRVWVGTNSYRLPLYQ
jgi:hypothetical protein